MTKAENIVEKKKLPKTKKVKQQHSNDKDQMENMKIEESSSLDVSKKDFKKKKAKKNKSKLEGKKKKDSVKSQDEPEDNLVFAVTETFKKNKRKLEGKKKKNKDSVKSQEETEDNSVFAVTERFLQTKKAKKEKKKLEGKKKSEFTKKSDEKLAAIQNFFDKETDETDKNVKSKPKWFDDKVKTLVTAYLVSVDNCEKDTSDQNETIRKQNEKKLYRFFHKLSTQLGEDVSVVKTWFHSTKQDILKSHTLKPDLEEPGVLKIAMLNRKIKAISKETSASPVVKTDPTPPAWFDEEFAQMLKVRQKAKRIFKLNPTEENKTAFREAFKRVKKELIQRKKTGFVSTKPYVNKPKAKNFGSKKPGSKPFGAGKPNNTSFGASNAPSNKPFGTSNGSFTPNKKHIKFDDA
uniref:Uncharacterized protein n=1 Tax=Cacopsylla melanoneura TaxID=428564 RepID=A0A8D8R350_9HEMI